MSDISAPPLVVKVGGSLYDLPDLGARLNAWLQSLSCPRVLLVPGGGRAVDVVRELDRLQKLGEERAHWLALAALRLNAEFLQALLPQIRMAASLDDCQDLWRDKLLPVLDAYGFALEDDALPGALPHSWAVTSDSIAARVANKFAARELILLKSITVSGTVSWSAASAQGFVDPIFPQAASGLPVRILNFRARTF